MDAQESHIFNNWPVMNLWSLKFIFVTFKNTVPTSQKTMCVQFIHQPINTEGNNHCIFWECYTMLYCFNSCVILKSHTLPCTVTFKHKPYFVYEHGIFGYHTVDKHSVHVYRSKPRTPDEMQQKISTELLADKCRVCVLQAAESSKMPGPILRSTPNNKRALKWCKKCSNKAFRLGNTAT
jgi:hypothetical protein